MHVKALWAGKEGLFTQGDQSAAEKRRAFLDQMHRQWAATRRIFPSRGASGEEAAERPYPGATSRQQPCPGATSKQHPRGAAAHTAPY